MRHRSSPEKNEFDPSYGDANLDLSLEVEKPQYGSIVDWMKVAESKALAFDLWARGNYTRRLIHNRSNGVTPILVPFQYVDELRWAHRRLSLMGLQAEYVYTGALGTTQKILMLHPAGDYLIDAGWGYIAALGSRTKMRGREWFPVLGYARPMPEAILDWITDEVPAAFSRGEIFVTPAELVGIANIDFDQGINMLTETQDGVLLDDSMKATELLASLELPYLDQLSATQFDRLLNEHADDLVRFRFAMRKLVHGEGAIEAAIDELRAEVAELRFSDSNQRMRADISRFGGVFTTFAATVGAAASIATRQPTSEAIAAATGAAVLAGAASTLADLWKQAAERKAKLREKKFSLFWSLGVQTPEAVRRRKTEIKFHQFNKATPAPMSEIPDCHWLCPPTNGMRFLSVRRTVGDA